MPAKRQFSDSFIQCIVVSRVLGQPGSRIDYKTDIGHKKASAQTQLFLTCLEGKTSRPRIISPSDYAWFSNVFFSRKTTPTDWNKLSLRLVLYQGIWHILYIYDIEAGVAFLDLMNTRPKIDGVRLSMAYSNGQ